MRNAQRAIGIVAAAAVAVVLGLAASAEEPKPAKPEAQNEGKPGLQDDIRVKPGGGHPLVPTLVWECVTHEIEAGKKGELGDDLLLTLGTLQVRATCDDPWIDAKAVRFKLPKGNYTIAKDGDAFKWTADKDLDKLKDCKHGVNCSGYHGIPPELMINVIMVADIHGTGNFVPIAELRLKGK